MYDFIGDIHGHAYALRRLLGKLGYEERHGVYRHPERRVVFLGDYIDRGPQIPETLALVRGMVEDAGAIALLGNHEYNALCFHEPAPGGGYLRPHTLKNFGQHAETLRQFGSDQRLLDDYLSWFRKLPFAWEEEGWRAVHASWEARQMEVLRAELPEGPLDAATLARSVDRGDRLFLAVEDVAKGVELPLPEGLSFPDKEGNRRTEARVRWWEDTEGRSLREVTLPTHPEMPDKRLEPAPYTVYGPEEKPVFFGHYWLQGSPTLQRSNVACLDYSIAKGGKLVAYRWEREAALREDHLYWVDGP
jgi:hypothetical protein